MLVVAVGIIGCGGGEAPPAPDAGQGGDAAGVYTDAGDAGDAWCVVMPTGAPCTDAGDADAACGAACVSDGDGGMVYRDLCTGAVDPACSLLCQADGASGC